MRGSTREDELVILEQAAAKEAEAGAFYLRAQSMVQSGSTRRLLAKLAEEEAVHELIVRQQADSLGVGRGWSLSDRLARTRPDVAAPLEGRIKPLERELRPGDSEQDVLMYALQLEGSAHSFYTRAADEARGEVARELYRRLAAMERGHFENLGLAYELIAQTGPQEPGGAV